MTDAVMGLLALAVLLPLVGWIIVLTVKQGMIGAFATMASTIRPPIERVFHGPPTQLVQTDYRSLAHYMADRPESYPIERVIRAAEDQVTQHPND